MACRWNSSLLRPRTWLGVEVQGQPQQPRTLLVSVPYALKAVEADKLAGKSVSDFVLSDSLAEQVRQLIEQTQAAAQSAPAVASAQTAVRTATSSSTNNSASLPTVFAGSTTNQIVLVQQSGTGAGLSCSHAAEHRGRWSCCRRFRKQRSLRPNRRYGWKRCRRHRDLTFSLDLPEWSLWTDCRFRIGGIRNCNQDWRRCRRIWPGSELRRSFRKRLRDDRVYVWCLRAKR